MRERESSAEQLPSTLDIIRINGHWAQMPSRDARGTDCTMIFLSDKGDLQHIDLTTYNLVRQFHGMVVGDLMATGNAFTDVELANIHWGPEQKTRPELKLGVTVFGEYEKK